jgi:hypothetical protein
MGILGVHKHAGGREKHGHVVVAAACLAASGSNTSRRVGIHILHLWKSMRLLVAVVEDLMPRLLLLLLLWMVGLWVLVLHYWHHHHYHWQRVFPL